MSKLITTQYNLNHFRECRNELYKRIATLNKENPIFVELRHDSTMGRNISDIKTVIIKRYINDNFSSDHDLKSVHFLNEDGNIKYIDMTSGLRFSRYGVGTDSRKIYLASLDESIKIKKLNNDGSVEILDTKDETMDLSSYHKNDSLPLNFLEWEEEHLTLLKMSI